ncbi:pyruvate dehydrogenase [Rhodocollybia butyracea]|uniref:3-methyl-2-oxobutanoate dehydrogenase (2-methylpropanoyl-transferring) n=1 Tax=Rhodocollybia butyracea TaxID=206335 RepID=A0A9P5PTC6_9AGAR|nr:pyruvate dehydrogenase [Rhodocollybia butyracea]
MTTNTLRSLSGSLSRAGTTATKTRISVSVRRRNATTATQTNPAASVEPPPAGGHLPSIAQSTFLKQTRDQALKTVGIKWADTELDEARGHQSSALGSGRETRKMNTYQAIRDALSIALATDDSAIVFGEDVAFGGVFRCTLGLAEEYGRERVFNTPLTEQGVVGFGIGYASMGMDGRTGKGGTAIAEIQFADYIWPAFDQLMNEASKFRYRSGGNFDVGGLTVRCPTMAVGHGGLYHSQSPEGFFLGMSGIKVVIPRSPLQAKGLLLASIRDPNPVVFMEPKVLYRSAVEQVPTSDYVLPLSSAETLVSGSDLTVVTYGTSVYRCEQAMHLLNNPPEKGAVGSNIRDAVKDWANHPAIKSNGKGKSPSIELIDLRTILPYDLPSVLQSVQRTGRLLVVHEGPVTGGVGMQLAGEIGKRAFLNLDAPVKVVGGWDTPGVALQYEKFYIPDEIRILDAMLEVLAY